MATQIQPIKLWGKSGPNPPKILILLTELDLPHEVVDWPISDVKKPEYVALNPNGRLPTIEDPNSSLTLWESGAIVEYLIERYDKEHKLSFPSGTNEAALLKQWLFFQTTGQAPYYGQAAWFTKFHPEKIPGAIDRYVKEMHRISAVLEDWLEKQKAKYETSANFDGPWLVGNKMTYADLSFITWQIVIAFVIGKDSYDQTQYTLVNEWIEKMTKREGVRKALITVGFIQE